MFNARSLVNKLSKFQSLVYASDCNVFCITETWLSDQISDGEILPSNFVLYRKDRPSRGGGVLIAVQESMYSTLISSPRDLEVVSVRLGLDNHFVICCVYVPPDSSVLYFSSLVNHLTEIVSSFTKCIIVGDFNLPDIDWSSLLGTSSLSNYFCEFVFDSNLTQHVTEPTHVKGNILDLVLTSPCISLDQLSVNSSSVAILSDHFLVYFIPSCTTSSAAKSKPGYVYDFSKANYNSMCDFLLDSDFSALFESMDIEFVWSVIKSFIYDAMFLFTPKIFVSHRHDPKWFNSEIRHHLKCLRSMRRKFKSHPTFHMDNKIQQSEKLLQSRIEQAKVVYESKLIESHLPRPHGSSVIYSYIRSISGQNALPAVLTLDSKSATSDEDKASLFNQYFHSVFTKTSLPLLPINEFIQPHTFIDAVTFDELDVFNALRSVDGSKAKGCDNISPMVLKHCAIALYQPLYHLFSLSLSQHYLPLEWRTHLIKPIYKSGEKSSVRNYRPISLLCIVSKVLEKIVYDNIVEYVTQSTSVYQFGFLRGRSTLQQLLLFFHKILTSASQTDVVYLDFKKAFDSVAHNELLLKLWKFGICGSLWLWFRAYLSNRLQYVSVGQSVSSVLPVLSGVPQGSILGPLLFIIFVNDLPTIASSSLLFLFADDAKCVMPVSSISDCLLLQNDLTRLVEWSTTWNLLLNEDKCSVTHFSTREFPITYNYFISGKQLPSKSIVRDLGVIVSANCQWSSHYQMIVSKAYKMLGMLRRMFSSSIAISAKRSLYLSLVRSQLLYCSPLWHPHLLTDIKCLETVQRRATRFIVNDVTMDYKDRLIRLRLLPLMMEFEISDIIFLVKSMKNPSTHFNIYNFIQCCSHSTRSSSSFKIRHSISRNNTLGNFYFNRIPRLWNSLPPLDINLSLPVIKSLLRNHFWNYFTSHFNSDNVCTYHYLCPCHSCSKLPVRMLFTM